MKLHSTLLAVSMPAFLFSVTTAHAADDSLSSFPHKAVPVLVKVDSHGKVTQISPAIELRPRYRSLIRLSIQEMIVGPATYQKRDIPSQLVMFLVPEATSRHDGQYDVRFTSVKNQPVPPGSWYWLHDNGHQLALVSESNRQNRGLRQFNSSNGYHSWSNNTNHTSHNAPTSIHQSPSRSVNSPSPGRARLSQPGKR